MSSRRLQNTYNDEDESDVLYNAETDVDRSEDEDEDEKQDIDYGSDTEDVIIEEDPIDFTEKTVFGDISDISSDSEDENVNISCTSPVSKIKIEKKEHITDLSINDIKVFDALDPDEKKYLPLNYIVSSFMEWNFIQEACASGFRSIVNLSRVSNKTIREVANISQYALDNGSAPIPKLNQAFINYAAQRGI